MKQSKMSIGGKRIAVLGIVMAIGTSVIIAILSLDLSMPLIGGLALAIISIAAYAIHREQKEEENKSIAQ